MSTNVSFEDACRERAQVCSASSLAAIRLSPHGRRSAANFGPPMRRFALGSLTKSFTATLAVAMLDENGLSPSTRLGDIWLDVDLPAHVLNITFVELVCHRSGLPRLPPNMPPGTSDPYALWTEENLISALQGIGAGRMLDSRGVFEYSNFGYAVIGAALCSFARKPFERLLNENVFEPLGLGDTSLATVAHGADCADTFGFGLDGQRAATWTFDAMAPAGAAVSTASDVERYLRELLEPTTNVGKLSRLAAVGDSGLTGGEPWGWARVSDGVSWHNGRTASHCSSIGIDHERGQGWAILWNVSSTVDDIVLAAASRGATQMPRTRLPIAAKRADVASFIGTYSGWLGDFSLREDVGAPLMLTGKGYGKLPLFFMEGGALRSLDFSIRLDRHESGVVEYLGSYPAKVRIRK